MKSTPRDEVWRRRILGMIPWWMIAGFVVGYGVTEFVKWWLR